MNRTQKGAWLSLGGAALCLSSMGIVYAAIFLPGNGLVNFRTAQASAALIVLYTVVGLVLYRRKQSPVEPEADERDKAIQKNAAIACFASVGISLAFASLIPMLAVGNKGSIPVFLLPIINFIIMYIALLVYSIAILLQYGIPHPIGGSAKGALS